LGVSYTSVHRIMNGKQGRIQDLWLRGAWVCEGSGDLSGSRTEHFWHSGDKSRLFTHFTKNAKYNNNLWEKCLSGSSKIHVTERKILQIRYLTYGWLFYKVHLLPPEKWQQNRTKIQNFIWVQPQPKQ
jgi:hypothetical protein